jgi:hypothetical protein
MHPYSLEYMQSNGPWGKWIVIDIAPSRGGNLYWLCKCECGHLQEIYGYDLRRGHSTKCRTCSMKGSKRALYHGLSKHYLRNTWHHIKSRCYNEKDTHYRWYGKRGIKMYEPWINDLLAFYDYIMKNLGERPERHTLDRKNNDGNYEPGNLRWATYRQQALNRSNSILKEEVTL